jgi:hypothetical protein
MSSDDPFNIVRHAVWASSGVMLPTPSVSTSAMQLRALCNSVAVAPGELPRALAAVKLLAVSTWRRMYGLADDEWDVQVVETSQAAQLLALTAAVRRRYPLLSNEGVRALSRCPVVYSDAVTLAKTQTQLAWHLFSTSASFVAIPRARYA